MGGYKKGANAERELIRSLYEKGFAVVRTAGSGKTAMPAPDLIALSPDKKLAFECKAWKGNYLSIAPEQFEELKKWGRMAGAEVYIAWKVPRQGWLFVPAAGMERRDRSFTISLRKAQQSAICLDVILGRQTQL